MIYEKSEYTVENRLEYERISILLNICLTVACQVFSVKNPVSDFFPYTIARDAEFAGMYHPKNRYCQ